MFNRIRWPCFLLIIAWFLAIAAPLTKVSAVKSRMMALFKKKEPLPSSITKQVNNKGSKSIMEKIKAPFRKKEPTQLKTKPQAHLSQLENMPRDIMDFISENLPSNDVINVAKASKTLRKMTNDTRADNDKKLLIVQKKCGNYLYYKLKGSIGYPDRSELLEIQSSECLEALLNCKENVKENLDSVDLSIQELDLNDAYFLLLDSLLSIKFFKLIRIDSIQRLTRNNEETLLKTLGKHRIQKIIFNVPLSNPGKLNSQMFHEVEIPKFSEVEDSLGHLNGLKGLIFSDGIYNSVINRWDLFFKSICKVGSGSPCSISSVSMSRDTLWDVSKLTSLNSILLHQKIHNRRTLDHLLQINQSITSLSIPEFSEYVYFDDLSLPGLANYIDRALEKWKTSLTSLSIAIMPENIKYWNARLNSFTLENKCLTQLTIGVAEQVTLKFEFLSKSFLTHFNYKIEDPNTLLSNLFTAVARHKSMTHFSLHFLKTLSTSQFMKMYTQLVDCILGNHKRKLKLAHVNLFASVNASKKFHNAFSKRIKKLVGTGIQMNGFQIQVFIEKVAEFAHTFDHSQTLGLDVIHLGWL